MQMPDYLKAIEYAASTTLGLIWSEHEELEVLQRKIAALTSEIKGAQETIEFLQANPDFDNDLQATYMHWESYFGPEKDLFYEDRRKSDLEALVEVRRFSTESQSGSILQYAKDGISLVHNGPNACPDGREIGTQALRSVIWQSRN